MSVSNQPRTTSLKRSLAEIAEGGLPGRIRLEQAARIIVTARRIAASAGAGFPVPASSADARAVNEIARHWDATLLTAVEYAEGLPEAALDRLLRAAPGWAAAFQAATPHRLAA